MKFEKYREWSQAWTNARTDADVESIIELWGAPIPEKWQRSGWKAPWGYRKNSKKGAEEKGEKGIERKLLGDQGKLKMLSLRRNGCEYPVLSAYHHFPLTKIKSGQVISDVLGIVLAGDRLRPLLIEVKTTANDSWYALVECLKQVRLARGDDERICQYLNRVVTKIEEGAWGLVVAPAAYFTKRKDLFEKCNRLLERLRADTEARIGFAASDRADRHQLIWVTGNWS